MSDTNQLKPNESVMTDDELRRLVAKQQENSILAKIFPVLPQEFRMVCLMTSMFVIISFVYSFLRIYKDNVVYSVLDDVQTKDWLKLFTFVTTQILVVVSQNFTMKSNFNDAFNKLVFLFCTILFINGFLMFFSDYVQPNSIFSDSLFAAHRFSTRGFAFFYPFMLIFNHWTYSCFYIIAEVIGSLMVSFCFMTYVNNNTSPSQCKRFVKILYFFSNISSLISGIVAKMANDYFKYSTKEKINLGYFIFSIGAIVFYGIVLLIKKVLEKHMETKIVISAVNTQKKVSKKKAIGFIDSIYLMFNSNLLLNMTLLALFYNISSNILENLGSAGMSASANYLKVQKAVHAGRFKSYDTIVTSLFTSIIVISPLSYVIDKYGIKSFSYVPLVVVFASIFVHLFFSTINLPAAKIERLFPFSKIDVSGFSGNFYIIAENYASTISTSFLKISKYAFFDVVKEALAMRIDPDSRPLFKGVVDGSMSKFGKCAGAIYGIFMRMIFESSDCRYYAPISGALLLLFVIRWFFAISYLSNSFQEAEKSGAYMNPDLADIKSF